MGSPFLEIPPSQWVASNDLAFAIRDRFPVSPGHTLIITKRLVATWFEATRQEQLAILELIDEVRAGLERETRRPDGYNVGFNVDAAGGQTVPHLHVHVIPRFTGDMEDPRGGVRLVIPWQGNYVAKRPQALATGGADDPFIRHIEPALAQATHIFIVAAFIQESGLALLVPWIDSGLTRGTEIQILTGDYLEITQVAALQRLLDWENAEHAREPEAGRGKLTTRVIESNRLPGGPRAFHPKSWRFESPLSGVAFVGSSNVSRSALQTGIEWNLRVDRGTDPRAYAEIAAAFDRLWTLGLPLTQEWVDEYAERAARAPQPLPPGEEAAEPLLPPPPKHRVQEEALQALARARQEGRTRALTVLATGLGKTWLAAFDVHAFQKERERWPRVLFIAHRQELLSQAATTFRRLFHEVGRTARITWCAGELADLSGDVVLASIQKLARPDYLDALRPDAFQYVIVDEVHHADAETYRRVLQRLSPEFMLGLTATPERSDDGDVAGLFDDHIAHRADLGVGVELGLLVPFSYFGLKDEVDYSPENIPWRNRRFDPEALTRAVETQSRMEQLWAAWQEHPGTRSLVFCCSIHHAVFVRDWLAARGVRVQAIYSGPGSPDRATTLDAFRAGSLDAICSVDVFNEGVDVPEVDRVVMLRPTESSVIFIQQLGRGLRRARGKERLTVIDFVGNHRVFLNRVRTLLSLAGGRESIQGLIEALGPLELPSGCRIDIHLEAVELLEKLLPKGRLVFEHAYRERREAWGRRPRLGEMYRAGFLPSRLRPNYPSWFDFVEAEGDLDEQEQRVMDRGRAWLRSVESTEMSKSFKMVVLEVLLEREALRSGMPLDELADRSHAFLVRSPELLRDIEDVKELRDPMKPGTPVWRSYWRTNPITAWGKPDRSGHQWFRVEGDRFVPQLPIQADQEQTFAAMTRELVDYRLARYRRRNAEEQAGDAFTCKVTWNQRDPILKLPSRTKRPDVPAGETDVRLPDGAMWQFKMAQEFCNVARPVGTDRNRLPDLMRTWFGPQAGHPGTDFHVRFFRSPDGWWIEPEDAQVLSLPERGRLVTYPTLRAAAGGVSGPATIQPEAGEVRLPSKATGPDVFAIRADGDSMDGGRDPIRDGDWLVMRYARGAGIGAIERKIALVEATDSPGDTRYQLKRVVKEGDRWMLRSDNPARESFEAGPGTTPIATHVETIPPERLAPREGTELPTADLGTAFQITSAPKTGRVDGHLFFLATDAKPFAGPDRLRWETDRRPGETAFILLKVGRSKWRYCGVGRWNDAERLWRFPSFDRETWKQLGGGRSASRTLQPEALARAEEYVRRLLDRHPPDTILEAGGRRFRIRGKASRGGIRIDGGPGDFEERTVSLVDLGWVLAAAEHAAKSGEILDEKLVNRLRYLEGTEHRSTRFIDTEWALRLHAASA